MLALNIMKHVEAQDEFQVALAAHFIEQELA
jgi:hypothetical protein